MTTKVPFQAQTRSGKPFLVWHVCSICQQPRSARYHQEHPVNDGDAQPIHTACHRCAAKSPLPLPLPLALTLTLPPSLPDVKEHHRDTQFKAQQESPPLRVPDSPPRYYDEMRRTVHVETEHYREAERRLQSHPRAFTYGRMVRNQEKTGQPIIQHPPSDIQSSRPSAVQPSRPPPPATHSVPPAMQSRYQDPEYLVIKRETVHQSPPLVTQQSRCQDPEYLFVKKEIRQKWPEEDQQASRFHQHQSRPSSRSPPLVMKPRYQEEPEYLVSKRETIQHWPGEDFNSPRKAEHPPFVTKPRYQEPEYLFNKRESVQQSRPPVAQQPRYQDSEYKEVRKQWSEENTSKAKRFMSHPEPRPAPLGHVKRRVSFAEEDDIATLPPDLPSQNEILGGLSRMRVHPHNLDEARVPHPDEFERRQTQKYIDETERSYTPEPNRALAHALSESPARERPLSHEEELELAPSFAHGPYRAETSPTPSMEVHVDSEATPRALLSDERDKLYTKQPSDFHHRVDHQTRYQPSDRHRHRVDNQIPEQPRKSDKERQWTRYVTVKEYRDEKGPWKEVEEKIVFDDEA